MHLRMHKPLVTPVVLHSNHGRLHRRRPSNRPKLHDSTGHKYCDGYLTTRHIITDLTRQMGCSEDHLLERVLRDPQDARRFYVTYRTVGRKTTATRKGFYIGKTHIKPTDGNTTGYIPFPLYYIDKQTLNELLTPYGHVVLGEFVETALHTRIGGYKFTINLKRNAVPPKTLEYNGCIMDIKYDDDLRHLIHQCRTKAADDQHHKQRRALEKDETTSEWKSDREAVLRKDKQERLAIQRQYTTLLNASADVYNSAIITLEQATSTPWQIAAITAVYDRDQ